MSTTTPPAETPTTERPRTTTRDPEALRQRLEVWLADRLPAGAAARVQKLEMPSTNGMSSETLLFEAAWREGGAERRESLVARLAPESSAVPVFPEYDLERQFRDKKEMLAKKEEIMQGLRKNQQLPVHFLEELANSLPDDVWFREITQRGMNISIML